MSLQNRQIVVPLINAALEQTDTIELGTGCSIVRISQGLVEHLQNIEGMTAGYERVVPDISVGLRLVPEEALPNVEPTLHRVLPAAIFSAMVLRLCTGVPVDVPFWATFDGDDVQEVGRTLVRTYLLGPRHTYPLDADSAFERLELLSAHYGLRFRRLQWSQDHREIWLRKRFGH